MHPADMFPVLVPNSLKRPSDQEADAHPAKRPRLGDVDTVPFPTHNSLKRPCDQETDDRPVKRQRIDNVAILPPRDETRFFNVIHDDGSLNGSIVMDAKTHESAVHKTFAMLLKSWRSGKPYRGEEIAFSLVDCTYGGDHRTYHYRGKLELMPIPIEITAQRWRSGVLRREKVPINAKKIIQELGQGAGQADISSTTVRLFYVGLPGAGIDLWDHFNSSR